MESPKSQIFQLCKALDNLAWVENGIDYTSEKTEWMWNDFWKLLINIGAKFEDDTLSKIDKYVDADRWNPCIHNPGEGHYHLAAQMGHISFCRAYEKLVGRKPFITKNIDYGSSPFHRYNVHNSNRTQGRLALNCRFIWQKEYVWVTSFKDESSTLIACSYHPSKEYGRGNKIKKRYTITNDDLLISRKNLE